MKKNKWVYETAESVLQTVFKNRPPIHFARTVDYVNDHLAMTNCQKQAILRPIVPVAQTRSFTAANADNVDSDHLHKIAGLLVGIRHNIFYGSEMTKLLLIDTRCFKKNFPLLASCSKPFFCHFHHPHHHHCCPNHQSTSLTHRENQQERLPGVSRIDAQLVERHKSSCQKYEK